MVAQNETGILRVNRQPWRDSSRRPSIKISWAGPKSRNNPS